MDGMARPRWDPIPGQTARHERPVRRVASGHPLPPPKLVDLQTAFAWIGVSRAWGYRHLLAPSGPLVPVHLAGSRRTYLAFRQVEALVDEAIAAAGADDHGHDEKASQSA